MTVRLFTTAAVAAALFAATAPATATGSAAATWTKPGATQGDTAQAIAACKRHADENIGDEDDYAPPIGRGVPAENIRRKSEAHDELVANCMKRKGYRRAGQ